MKLTIGEALAAQTGLGMLQKEKLPIKGAYWLARLGSALNVVLKDAEEKRQELFKEYGHEKDGIIEIPAEKSQAFLDALKPLLEIEVEIMFKPIKLNDLGDSQVALENLVFLHRFIEDDEDTLE